MPPPERRWLAQFNQRFEFFPFRFLQEAFVVAIHQFHETTVRLQGKMEISNGLYPVHWRGNC